MKYKKSIKRIEYVKTNNNIITLFITISLYNVKHKKKKSLKI